MVTEMISSKHRGSKSWNVDRRGKDYITLLYNQRFNVIAMSGTTAAHVTKISSNS